jgi:tetratricopeptide (TPR) repeat protein
MNSSPVAWVALFGLAMPGLARTRVGADAAVKGLWTMRSAHRSALWFAVFSIAVGGTGTLYAAENAGAAAMAAVANSAIAHDPAMAAMVAQELAKLAVKPKVAITPSDRSYETLAAIRRGDYATANRIAQDVLSHSRLARWHFYPFNAFMSTITRGGNDPALLDNLNAWLKREPKSAIAHLIRSRYYEDAAWEARQGEVAERVPPNLMSVYVEDLRRSADDVKQSIRLDPSIPWSYYQLVNVISGHGNTPAMETAFQIGVKAYPGYYELYRARLYSLTPRWGGSIEAMYAFVDKYAGHAPDNSPLKLLYMQLYANLLDGASFNCGGLKYEERQHCVEAEIVHTARPALVDGISKALNLYKTTDPAEFTDAVWPVLGGMMACGCTITAGGGALLQEAARIMDSDNRIADEAVHNNYVLDDITARVWARMGNGSNAEKKYLEALDDVEHTQFPDEQRKEAARAAIYNDLASYAGDNRDYLNLIVYEAAANAAGGENHSDSYGACYAYYKLKHYAEGVAACSRLIEANNNTLVIHYWRALSYQGLRQWDAAMADFQPVADGSNNTTRVGSAIEMSVILGNNEKDLGGELALLNRYSFLFDSAIQNSVDLAIAYNNRCHANMELGKLKEALDDCTASLRYDHIPDAFQKQQKLLKRLSVTGSN